MKPSIALRAAALALTLPAQALAACKAGLLVKKAYPQAETVDAGLV